MIQLRSWVWNAANDWMYRTEGWNDIGLWQVNGKFRVEVNGGTIILGWFDSEAEARKYVRSLFDE